MHFPLTTSTFLILPLLALSSPVSVSEADAVSDAPVFDPREQSGVVDATTLFNRASGADCKIINVNSYVNCRSGPGTQYPVVYKLPTGVKIHFDCYKRGECVGGNCTWDRFVSVTKNCFASGYYTDSACTI
ncbi:hypothetical protein VE03_08838, partial [Pseudogymnoascus sp. 23342-1-I1]